MQLEIKNTGTNKNYIHVSTEARYKKMIEIRHGYWEGL